MSFKIYTKTGDKGTTSLFGGEKVSKAHMRIEAYGTIDELNSYLGLVAAEIPDERCKSFLISIQHQLFSVGATLATTSKTKLSVPSVQDVHVKMLEDEIDFMENNLEPLKNFILPGGSVLVANCHISRCICRRAERCMVQLNENEPINKTLLTYINRLSDFLFVLARYAGKLQNVNETIWKSI